MTTLPELQALKARIEDAASRRLSGSRASLRFVVDRLELESEQPNRLRIRSTLHFHDKGSPYCCGEPLCHLGARFCDLLARELRASAGTSWINGIELDDIAVAHHDSVTFDVDVSSRD